MEQVQTYYVNDWQCLPEPARQRALIYLATLCQNHVDGVAAASIARLMARTWYEEGGCDQPQHIDQTLYIMPQEQGWCVRHFDSEGHLCCWFFDQEKEAIAAGLHTANHQRYNLILFAQDGKVRGRYLLY